MYLTLYGIKSLVGNVRGLSSLYRHNVKGETPKGTLTKEEAKMRVTELEAARSVMKL